MGSTFEELYKKIKFYSKVNLSWIDNPLAKLIIQNCLIIDENKRPTFSKLKEIIKTYNY